MMPEAGSERASREPGSRSDRLDHAGADAPPPVPLVFGDPGRQLFGWHHLPASAEIRKLGVVLCPPFGYEVMCSHRSYRALAGSLARAGFHVLRFDLEGCGDSDGSDGEGSRLEAWLSSVDTAVSTLRQRSGVAAVCLFGLRLGALLALTAAKRRDDVHALALWATPASGKAYVREARALGRLQRTNASRHESVDGLELVGYRLSPGTLEDLSRLEVPAQLPGGTRWALTLGRDDVPSSEDELCSTLDGWGVDVEASDVHGYAAMMRDPEFSDPPMQAIEVVRDWMARVDEREAQPAGLHLAPQPGTRFEVHASDGQKVQEDLVRFGSGGNLFGILTTPGATHPHRDHAVLFLSVGANHHIGSNRLYVRLARRLATQGFACLRFDIAGVGDSAPPTSGDENRLYALDSVGDLRAAMDEVTRRLGIQRFVLAGICSGAYLAFHAAARDARVVGQVLINPQVFVWQKHDTLDIKKRFFSSRFYKRALFDPRALRKLVKGDVNVRGIVGEVVRRVAQRLLSWLPVPDSLLWERQRRHREVRRSFHKMTDRGVDSLLVYGVEDAGLDTLERYLGKEARALAGRRSFRLVVVEDVDHTFTPQWSQNWLGDLMVDHLASRFE